MIETHSQMKISQLLEQFYGEQKLGTDAFEKSINFANLGILKVPFPNLKMRRQLVHLHDINHLLSGYDTSWTGEGEVAAWELASGFPKHCWIGYLYAPFTLLIGFGINPKRILKAYKKGRQQKNSCHANIEKDEIMNMSLVDLKTLLGFDLNPF